MIELLVSLAILILCLVLGLHIGISLALSGAIGILMITDLGVAFRAFSQVPYFSTTNFVLTTVPMFVLMAEFLIASTLASRLFHGVNVWLAGIRGGLAHATVVASAGLGSVSGVSAASAATMAGVAVPEMRKYGYHDRLSLGTVAGAGTLSAMIPPSAVLIIYGIITETSIGTLFIAAIIPGIISAIFFLVTVAVWVAWKKDMAPPSQSYPLKEKLASLKELLPLILLIGVVLGGLYTGVVTATEAGAVGALGAFVIAVAFGGLRFEGVVRAVRRTLHTTAMIFFIIFGATMFSQFLALTRTTQNLTSAIADSQVPAGVVLAVILLLYIVLGMFLDTTSMLVLTLPVVFPLLTGLGFDGIWLGILIVKVAEVGLITPPVGMNVFVTTGAVPDAKLGDGFAGASTFLAAEVVVIALLVAFPMLALWLPLTMS